MLPGYTQRDLIETTASPHGGGWGGMWEGHKNRRRTRDEANVDIGGVTPQLDFYGQQGWELVSIPPVVVGSNGEILIDERNHAYHDTWAWTYLCVFKRPTELEASSE